MSRTWKTLERHPLSAEYDDITGPSWDRFKNNYKRVGILNERKITLYEGKVLDGWQLLRCCIEFDRQPDFQTLPEHVDPKAFVETMQDHRRHETPEQVEKRVVARRGRVVDARVNGESLRTIAENEGVAVATVQRDLEASTVPGGTVTPPDGKITGQDGREQPAKKPRPLCENCQKSKDKGVPLIKKCEDCKALRAKPKKPKPEPSDADETVILDCLKKPVPEYLRDVFSQVAEFRSIMHGIAALRSRCDDLGKHAAGGWIDQQDLDRMLKQAHAHLRFAMPHTECPKCRRKVKEKCPHCKGTGWLCESAYGSCASDDDKKWAEGRS